MKFVLILIAAILMFLGIYTYSNQTTEKSAPTAKTFEKKVEAQETEKISVVTKEVKEKKSSVKNIAVKSPKVVSQMVSRETEDEMTISEGLSLEGIEDADVSAYEKERMIDKLANYKNSQTKSEPVISIEEVVQIIEKDFEQGLIN